MAFASTPAVVLFKDRFWASRLCLPLMLCFMRALQQRKHWVVMVSFQAVPELLQSLTALAWSFALVWTLCKVTETVFVQGVQQWKEQAIILQQRQDDDLTQMREEASELQAMIETLKEEVQGLQCEVSSLGKMSATPTLL